MTLPRLTTRGAMFGVALVAANLAAHRRMNRFEFLDLVPSLDLLAVGVYLAIDQRARRGEVRPFLLGSLAFGWVAILTFAVLRLVSPVVITSFRHQGVSALRWSWFEYVEITGVWTNNHWNLVSAVFYWLATFSPQMLFALLGGWIARRFDLAWIGGRGRSWRTLAKVIAVAGWLSIASTTTAILYRTADDFRAKADGLAYSEQLARSQSNNLDRLAIAIENDPEAWAIRNGKDPHAEIAWLRALVAESRRRADHLSELEGKNRRAARRPWWPVAPDPPPPSGP